MKTNCKFCKKEINKEPNRIYSSKNVFCSSKCQHDFYRKKHNVFCKICGLLIIITNQQFTRNKGNGFYCSRKCYFKSKLNQIISVCEYCGNEYSISLSKFERHNHNYCSPNCTHLSRRKRIIMLCEYCGGQFETTPSKLIYNGSKYCSDRCKYAGLLSKKCARCGIPIKRESSKQLIYCRKCHQEIYRTSYRKCKLVMSDGYIKNLLTSQTGIPRSDIPSEFILLKRLEREAKLLISKKGGNIWK